MDSTIIAAIITGVCSILAAVIRRGKGSQKEPWNPKQWAMFISAVVIGMVIMTMPAWNASVDNFLYRNGIYITKRSQAKKAKVDRKKKGYARRTCAARYPRGEGKEAARQRRVDIRKCLKKMGF